MKTQVYAGHYSTAEILVFSVDDHYSRGSSHVENDNGRAVVLHRSDASGDDIARKRSGIVDPDVHASLYSRSDSHTIGPGHSLYCPLYGGDGLRYD